MVCFQPYGSWGIIVLNDHHQNLRQLTSQKSENETVKKEFELLEEEGGVWKLVGPILIKQDRGEAIDNVGKRLEFITSELKRCEANIKSVEEEFETKRLELVKIQEQIQPVAAQ